MNCQHANRVVQLGAQLAAAMLCMGQAHSWPVASMHVAGTTVLEARSRWAAPDIWIEGNGLDIPDGDMTPNLGDGTDYGVVSVGNCLEHEFRVGNNGTADLQFNTPPNPKILGPNAGDFVVSDSVTLDIQPGVDKRFAILFCPSASGLRTATVQFDSNDPDEDPYTFAIQGWGGCGQTYCDTNPDNAADIAIDGCDCSAGSIKVWLTGAPVNQFAYLLIGAGSATTTNPPGALGDLCLIGGPIGRYSLDAGVTNGSGSMSTDILNSVSGGGGGNIPNPPGGNICSPAGQTWNFQYWHRDGMNPSKFSKAISVTFQ